MYVQGRGRRKLGLRGGNKRYSSDVRAHVLLPGMCFSSVFSKGGWSISLFQHAHLLLPLHVPESMKNNFMYLKSMRFHRPHPRNSIANPISRERERERERARERERERDAKYRYRAIRNRPEKLTRRSAQTQKTKHMTTQMLNYMDFHNLCANYTNKYPWCALQCDKVRATEVLTLWRTRSLDF